MASKEKAQLGSVLVVGGCGFVGHHIVHQLLADYSCTVSVLDIRTDINRQPNVSYYDGDITSKESVISVLQNTKAQIVIHTASPSAILENSSRAVKQATDRLFYKVNVNGTRNLLDCAVESGTVKAFVFTSSASVIHDNVSDLVNADERYPVLHAPVQTSYYAETKALAEEMVLSYNRQIPASAANKRLTPKPTEMLTCALRPSGVFGEGDQVMIPNMLRAYAKAQTRFQLGGNDNLFDMTYVGNVAHAHCLAALALLATSRMATSPLDNERVDGEAFLITNGTPVYFWDFARSVWKCAGDRTEPSKVWVIDQEIGLILGGIIEWVYWGLTFGGTPNMTRQKARFSSMTRYFSPDKAMRRLGYEPLFDLQDGIERSVKWALEKEGKAK